MLLFNPADHSYTWEGFPVPSLSELLEIAGVNKDFSQIDPGVLERKRLLGSAVHAAIAAELLGQKVQWQSEADRDACSGYMASWERAMQRLDLSGSNAQIEKSAGGWCGFGTTPDYVDDDAIVEWKCTSRLYPSVWVQLAGQEYAIRPVLEKRRIAVRLDRSGIPQIKEDKTPELHNEVWKAVMVLCRWKGKLSNGGEVA